jgi:hypothetical protein
MPSMPQSWVLSQASSDPDEVVVGVDTHCPLPRSWDHLIPSFATGMGPGFCQ